MSQEEIKKAYDAAQKSIKEEKEEKVAALVKSIVKETLEKLESIEERIKELNEQKKQLKMTIDDLKGGRLDLLQERLEKDETAKAVNVIIIKKTINNYPSWNTPYVVEWKSNFPSVNTVWYGNSTTGGMVNASLTNQDVKHYAVGTYCTNSGVINLR